MAAGFMSRISNADRVAMQFVQASAGMEPVTLSVKPGSGGATAQLARLGRTLAESGATA